jgi:DNA-binding transcriptional LysR family regulator
MHDWDDLRFFLAVAQTGSVTAASRRLRVNQSTVSRRINAFEQELRVRLFDRFSSGYQLTPEGEELFRRALHIEEETHAIERQVMGKNVELSGPIRVTTSLAIARYMLIPLLQRFHRMHPGIVVHLDLSNGLYNLTAREADVAIRVTRDAIPETLIGRELGKIEYGVYGERKYIDRHARAKGKAILHWIGEDNSQDRPAWLPGNVGPLQLVLRTNDVLATLDVLKQGMGVGRLPRFIGDSEKTLKQMPVTHEIAAVPVWLLTHADMRRVNRITAFTSFIANELRDPLIGKRRGPAVPKRTTKTGSERTLR